MKARILAAVAAVLCFCSFHAAGQLIPNSYIVSFKPPAPGERPFIWPAVRTEDRPGQAPVPFGEHSSGQSKAEIAAALNLVGEVVSIFETINAIHVRVDAAEAERLSRHPLVAAVEQDRYSVAMTQPRPTQPRPVGEFASYQDGVLIVPRVDTTAQVGKFQQARFVLRADGAWDLTEVHEWGVNVGRYFPAQVEVKTVGTLPQSVYLHVTGSVTACPGALRVQQRRTGTHFEVVLGYVTSYLTEAPDSIMLCPAVMMNFSTVVPLDVYGLSAGTYTFDVDGVTGDFSLASDNKFPD